MKSMNISYNILDKKYAGGQTIRNILLSLAIKIGRPYPTSLPNFQVVKGDIMTLEEYLKSKGYELEKTKNGEIVTIKIKKENK